MIGNVTNGLTKPLYQQKQPNPNDISFKGPHHPQDPRYAQGRAAQNQPPMNYRQGNHQPPIQHSQTQLPQPQKKNETLALLTALAITSSILVGGLAYLKNNYFDAPSPTPQQPVPAQVDPNGQPINYSDDIFNHSTAPTSQEQQVPTQTEPKEDTGFNIFDLFKPGTPRQEREEPVYIPPSQPPIAPSPIEIPRPQPPVEAIPVEPPPIETPRPQPPVEPTPVEPSPIETPPTQPSPPPEEVVTPEEPLPTKPPAEETPSTETPGEDVVVPTQPVDEISSAPETTPTPEPNNDTDSTENKNLLEQERRDNREKS